MTQKISKQVRTKNKLILITNLEILIFDHTEVYIIHNYIDEGLGGGFLCFPQKIYLAL